MSVPSSLHLVKTRVLASKCLPGSDRSELAYLALSPLRFGLTVSRVSDIFVKKRSFPGNRRLEMRGQKRKTSCLFWAPFVEKCTAL